MKTKAPPHVASTITELRRLLKLEAKHEHIALEVPDDGYVEEGGWLSIIVRPVEPDADAYEYVEELEKLESKLRKRIGRSKVTLVPAIAG